MLATWIEASRAPVVPGTKIHAMAATPLLLYGVWWSWTTFLLVLIVSLVMGYLQLKGRHPMWVVRRFRCRLRGGLVNARPLWYRRRRTRIETYEDLDVHQAYAISMAASASPKPASTAKRAPRAGRTKVAKEGRPT